MKIYHIKCQSLEEEKELLKNDKCQLEWEVSRLKTELDTISVSSGSSHYKGISQSCSSLLEINVRRHTCTIAS